MIFFLHSLPSVCVLFHFRLVFVSFDSNVSSVPSCPQWLWLFSPRLACHNLMIKWTHFIHHHIITWTHFILKIHIYIFTQICNKILHLNRIFLHLPYSHRTHRHLPDVGCQMSQVSTCVALELPPTSHGQMQNTFRTSKWFVFKYCIFIYNIIYNNIVVFSLSL